jgi:2-polyprenyl-3-methyl-5-hydroxy-6-metoxy-1,4-benzoquinol methylase
MLEVRKMYDDRVGEWDRASRDPNEASTRRVTFGAALVAKHAAAGSRCLDIGGATGLLCELLHRGGFDVYDTDISPSMLQVCAERLGALGVPADHFRVSENGSLPYPDSSFDVVTGLNVLLYVEDHTQFTREVGRVLRPGGLAIVDTYNMRGLLTYLRLAQLPFRILPVRRSFWRVAASWWRTGTTAAAKFPHLLQAAQARTPDALDRLFSAEGFELVEGHGLTGIGWWDRRLIEKGRAAFRRVRRRCNLYIGIYRKSGPSGRELQTPH